MIQLTILFGGWLVMLLNNPLPALVLLIVLKVAADLRARYGDCGANERGPLFPVALTPALSRSVRAFSV